MTLATDTADRPEPQPATPERIKALDEVSLLARRALLAMLNLRTGSLIVTLPSGQALRFDGEPDGQKPAELNIRDMRLISRVLTGGHMAFAEAYMDGDWDTPDLTRLLTMFGANWESIDAVTRSKWAFSLLSKIQHFLRGNTKRGAERNIHAHYDLGNAFYSLWLDPSMTYSSAVMAHEGQDLTAAQENKYRALAEKMELRRGQRVLEIGCGWGGFAEYAAREVGAEVVGLTISREQLDFAQARMQKAQLGEKVDIRYCDYRDMDGKFDAIASIEMFEAVGERYWPAYFGKIRDLLGPGGRAGLQIITIRDDLFGVYRHGVDFIQKYVFPGGMLPSPERLEEEFGKAGLKFEGADFFPDDYADTLAIWREKFDEVWDDIRALGFDERFRRLWRYYLSYCEAGFRTRRISVGQFALSTP